MDEKFLRAVANLGRNSKRRAVPDHRTGFARDSVHAKNVEDAMVALKQFNARANVRLGCALTDGDSQMSEH